MDPILVLAGMVGMAALGFFVHSLALFFRPPVVIQHPPQGTANMANVLKTVESYVLSPAGLNFILAGLTALENSAEVATTDPGLKQIEALAFQVINDKVRSLAPVPAPSPAPASTVPRMIFPQS